MATPDDGIRAAATAIFDAALAAWEQIDKILELGGLNGVIHLVESIGYKRSAAIIARVRRRAAEDDDTSKEIIDQSGGAVQAWPHTIGV